MRTIIALLLAAVLAAVAYAGFWWFSLAYNAKEMKGSVEQALGGTLSYGEPQWLPEWMAVHVKWPDARLVLASGPIREIEAGYLGMISGFLSKDRWTLELPPEFQVHMANGSTLVLQTRGGQIVLLEAPSRIAFRADELTVMNSQREVLAHINDVMVERSPTSEGVKLNLASRPHWDGEEALLSGQLVLPTDVAASFLASFGEGGVPRLGDVLRNLAFQLSAKGGTAVLDNISFRSGNVSGAVYGTLRVVNRGDFAGSLAITADSPSRLMAWIERAGVVNARNVPERLGWMDMRDRLEKGGTALRVEVTPQGLLLNGAAVGPIPKVHDVLTRLWP